MRILHMLEHALALYRGDTLLDAARLTGVPRA